MKMCPKKCSHIKHHCHLIQGRYRGVLYQLKRHPQTSGKRWTLLLEMPASKITSTLEGLNQVSLPCTLHRERIFTEVNGGHQFFVQLSSVFQPDSYRDRLSLPLIRRYAMECIRSIQTTVL